MATWHAGLVSCFRVFSLCVSWCLYVGIRLISNTSLSTYLSMSVWTLGYLLYCIDGCVSVIRTGILDAQLWSSFLRVLRSILHLLLPLPICVLPSGSTRCPYSSFLLITWNLLCLKEPLSWRVVLKSSLVLVCPWGMR